MKILLLGELACTKSIVNHDIVIYNTTTPVNEYLSQNAFDLLIIDSKYFSQEITFSPVLLLSENIEKDFSIAQPSKIQFLAHSSIEEKELNFLLQCIEDKNFNIDKYLENYKVIGEYSRIRKSEIRKVKEEIAKYFADFYGDDFKSKLNAELILEELTANAIYHAFGKSINLKILKDEYRHIFVMRDKFGKLTKEEILYWFKKNAEKDNFLDHGRGLYLIRVCSDRLIFNIKKDVQTEIIVVNFINKTSDKSDKIRKPLYIFENE